ncbi:MAG: hypothetical protein JSW09_10520 [Pseudomonadota bacterium]|nr:MAG: hypothetical protein JSW09_10520 [Pseudomonadota bacterium]
MKPPIGPIVPVVAGTAPTSPHFFHVACVEKTHAPDGGHGQNWYRYVLKSRGSTITGHRCGSRKDVHAYAAECAQQLNLRAATSQSMWNPRGRKPAPPTG